jgi:pyruvate/2-oxoglutarate dehydrogenase complex dihydrolipoamide acyltransferase (E2) component
MIRTVAVASFLAVVGVSASAQAPEKARATPPSELTVDDSFDPPIAAPAFPQGKGPLVLVDEKHRDVVSLQTYLRPVGRFLRKDGYVVRPSSESVSARGLAKARIFVIANAQAPEGSPEQASAFSEAEVAAVEAWVRKGGGLLLIADRAPFGAPARPLARAFGVTLDDNTILRRGSDEKPDGVLTIDVSADGDRAHPILHGVSRVVYVVGESLDGPGPILRAPAGTYSGPTAQATDGPSAAGKPIVLAFSHGKGRVVIIGDAGIASAFGSVGGATHRGISEADNARFIRNVFRWLSR